MFLKRASAALALVALASATTLSQPADPMMGTWKLNVAKSKTTFKSGTTVIEPAGDGIKLTADAVGADGTAHHWGFTAKFDGKDNPVTGNSPYGPYGTNGVVALTKVDAHTAKIVSKLDGKVTLTQTLVVSADGKTRTVTSKGTDGKGQPIDTTAVYEKQ
jgi:hypothetical protein